MQHRLPIESIQIHKYGPIVYSGRLKIIVWDTLGVIKLPTHPLYTGPINKTVVDHWRMIWQERAHVIVMVTNVKEDKKIKCQQYWPDHDTKDFGPFRITLTDQEDICQLHN